MILAERKSLDNRFGVSSKNETRSPRHFLPDLVVLRNPSWLAIHHFYRWLIRKGTPLLETRFVCLSEGFSQTFNPVNQADHASGSSEDCRRGSAARIPSTAFGSGGFTR